MQLIDAPHLQGQSHSSIVLEGRALSKVYEKRSLYTTTRHQALHHVSLSLNKGESLGLVGLNGSGKSTLLRMLLGLESPDEGEVLLYGKPLEWHRRNEPYVWRRHMQVVFQDSRQAVNPRFTVEQILAEPLQSQGIHPSDIGARCVELLAMVGLDEATLTKRPLQCSGGMLQRVCIARAMALEPEILLLDESVSDLDLVAQIQILQLLAQLREEKKLSCLFVSHDLRAVCYLCQRILVLDQGTIVAQFTRGDNVSATEHPAVQKLLDGIVQAPLF